MDSNQTTTCCWYFQLKSFPTIEEIFDDNNNDLLHRPKRKMRQTFI
jgi:hypothetical protein